MQNGWIEGNDLWLIPEAALKAANDLAGPTEKILINLQTLIKRIADAKLLATTDKERNRLRVRKNILGQRRSGLLHVRASLLREKAAQPAQSAREGEKSQVPQGFDGDPDWATSEKNRPNDGPLGNGTGPIADSGDISAGPVSDEVGRDWAGSEMEVAQFSDAESVENPRVSEGETEIGPVGPVISEGETPDESTDDAFAIPDHLNRNRDQSESSSNGDAVEREPVGRSHEQLKF